MDTRWLRCLLDKLDMLNVLNAQIITMWLYLGTWLGIDRIPDRSTDPYPNILENSTRHARGPVQNISSVTCIPDTKLLIRKNLVFILSLFSNITHVYNCNLFYWFVSRPPVPLSSVKSCHTTLTKIPFSTLKEFRY